MKKNHTIVVINILLSINLFSQQTKIFGELNYNTFSHSSLQQFQKDFIDDLNNIPAKVNDNFPSNIGFTIGVDLVENNIGLFGSYNFTGGKISYSDYSGAIKITQEISAFTIGGIYYFDIFKDKRLKLGLKAFGTFSTLKLDSYANISNTINQESLGFKSFDFGTGAMIAYEYPLSFIIIRASTGFDLVFGGKLKFDNNSKFHLENNSGTPIKTEWTGLRTGIGVAFPF